MYCYLVIERKSIVLQARCNVKDRDEKIFGKETKYRRNYVINELSKKIQTIESKNMYEDFKK